MKKRILAMLLALTMVMQGLSTVVVYADDGIESEAATGSSIEDAIELTLDVEVEVTVGDAEGVYYKFTPEKSAMYSFLSYENEFDNYAYLLDTNGNQLTEDNDGNNSEENELAFGFEYLLKESTTYYLYVGATGTETGYCKVCVSEAKDAKYMQALEENVAVPYQGEAQLEVVVSSDYEDVEYQWCNVEEVYNDETGEFQDISYVPITSATDSAYKVYHKVNEEFEYRYACEVKWTEDNEEKSLYIDFYTSIDTQLSINAKDGETEIRVPIDEDVILEVEAFSGYNLSLTYVWFYWNDDKECWDPIVDESGDEPKTTCIVGGNSSLATQYRCEVNDTYNCESVIFTTKLVGSWTLDSEEETIEENYTNIFDGLKLSVNVTNEENESLTYQWYRKEFKDNEEPGDWTDSYVPLAGKEEASCTLSAADGTLASTTYKCVVSDSNGVTDEKLFHVSVATGLQAQSYWEDIEVTNGEDATLTVNITSECGLTLSYQWYCWSDIYEGEELLDSGYKAISGAEENIYTVTKDTVLAERYMCKVSDGYEVCEVYFYTILDTGLQASAEKDSFMVLEGTECILEVEATTNAGELTYFWYYEDPEKGQVNIGDNSSSCEITANSEISTYYCEVRDGYAEPITVEFSVEAIKVEEDAFDFSRTYTIQDGETKWYKVTVKENAAYHLFGQSAEDDSDSRMVIYNDQLEMICYSNRTEESEHFDVSFVFDADTVYYMQISSEMGAFTVVAEAENELTASPVGSGEVEIAYGESAELKVVATGGTGQLEYQWYYEDPDSLEEKKIEGATTNTYEVNTLGDILAYKYICKVSDESDGTEPITLPFSVKINTGLEVSSDDSNPVVVIGEKVELTVTASGSSIVDGSEDKSYKYQWYYWDENEYEYVLMDGKTTPTLEIEGSTELYSYYMCRVTDGIAIVDFDFYPELDTGLRLDVEDEDVTVAYGETATLSVTTTGGVGELTYRWEKAVNTEGDEYTTVDIEGATEKTYDVYADENAAKFYICSVSDGYRVVCKYFYMNYVGEIVDITDSATVSFDKASVVYNGVAQEPAPIVTVAGEVLKEDTHYTVEYVDNINVGTATVTITGKGKYKGTATGNFTITAANLANATIKLSQSSYTYDGNAKKPTVTVTIGGKQLPSSDYQVSHDKNTNAGTASVTVTAKSKNCTNSKTEYFTITAASISGATVKVDPTSFTYDGTTKTPKVTVTLSNGKTLTAGTDYDVTGVTNNAKAGSYTVTVTAKGNYDGVKTATYTINAASIANADVTIASVKYTGKALKPAVTVKVGNVTLKEGTDYTVTYSNNTNIGNGKVTITGKGNYEGNISKTFAIAVKKGDTFTVGAYNYKVTGTSTVEFAGIKSTKTTTVKVADTVKIGGKTFKVTSIADNALKGKTKVTKVTIGKNVTTIGKSAFEGCTKLSTVTIGANVTKIGDKAFKKCTALKKITIPAKVKTIGKEVFSGCKNLKTITIKSTKLTSVGKNALKGINSKATIKVPSKKLSAYKKLLKGTGQGSKVKIKK